MHSKTDKWIVYILGILGWIANFVCLMLHIYPVNKLFSWFIFFSGIALAVLVAISKEED